MEASTWIAKEGARVKTTSKVSPIYGPALVAPIGLVLL